MAPRASEILTGLETEYGIFVEGRDARALMEESRLLVCAYPHRFAAPWDYEAEDPRCDLRGYRVPRLNYDERDAEYDVGMERRYRSVEEQRADRVLLNGARFYNDHGHPEYATPECRSIAGLVAHDRAGERIVWESARRRAADAGVEIRIYKNNTDFHGASYGCHESYLVPRSMGFERLLAGLLAFWVTRQVFCGAGKVGVDAGAPPSEGCVFQLSQRADFFTEIASVDTLAKRPIFNTRDEPHANPGRFLRLHVICGDANMHEFSTALKVGTTRCVLALLDAGWVPRFILRDPVSAMRHVSRDPSLRTQVALEDGRAIPVLEVQRGYLEDARRLLEGADPETDWVLREWQAVLDDLEAEPARAEDRVDWVAKLRLLQTYADAEGLDWDDPMLRSLDLEYHNVDPEAGLYYALEELGRVRRVVTERHIDTARQLPPDDTRAAVRGRLIERFGDQIEKISWGRVGIRDGKSFHWLPLSPCLGGGESADRAAPDGSSGPAPAEPDAARASLAELLKCVDAAKTVSDLLAGWRGDVT